MSQIFVVIPVFNRWSYTEACLKSLIRQDFQGLHIVVVDHGSNDGTSDHIRADFPQVHLLNGDPSMWWSAATNVGVKFALDKKADFIVTLNNDLIVDEGYISALINAYNYYKPCIIGSLSLEIENRNKVHFCGVNWNPLSAKYAPLRTRYNALSDIPESTEILETDLLPGRGVLFPAKAFSDFGLFDEYKFPHYMADEDFSLKCKKNGYKLLVSTRAKVYSHTGATGLSNMHKKKGYKYWKDIFFSPRSPNNFKTRWNWARRNTSYPLVYLFFDYSRILYSKIFKGI